MNNYFYIKNFVPLYSKIDVEMNQNNVKFKVTSETKMHHGGDCNVKSMRNKIIKFDKKESIFINKEYSLKRFVCH